MRTRIAILAFVATTAALASAPAPAHRASTAATVMIAAATPASASRADYVGKVSSSRAACRRRTVSVYSASDPPRLLGRGRTDSEGRWAFRGDAPRPGRRIYAVVRVKTLRATSSHRHRCRAAHSARVPFPLSPL